jgi:hypothetical protein
VLRNLPAPSRTLRGLDFAASKIAAGEGDWNRWLEVVAVDARKFDIDTAVAYFGDDPPAGVADFLANVVRRCVGTTSARGGSSRCHLRAGHDGLHETVEWSGQSFQWPLLHQFFGCLGGPPAWDVHFGPDPRKEVHG